jgi:hypothetical protein
LGAGVARQSRSIPRRDVPNQSKQPWKGSEPASSPGQLSQALGLRQAFLHAPGARHCPDPDPVGSKSVLFTANLVAVACFSLSTTTTFRDQHNAFYDNVCLRPDFVLRRPPRPALFISTWTDTWGRLGRIVVFLPERAAPTSLLRARQRHSTRRDHTVCCDDSAGPRNHQAPLRFFCPWQTVFQSSILPSRFDGFPGPRHPQLLVCGRIHRSTPARGHPDDDQSLDSHAETLPTLGTILKQDPLRHLYHWSLHRRMKVRRRCSSVCEPTPANASQTDTTRASFCRFPRLMSSPAH